MYYDKVLFKLKVIIEDLYNRVVDFLYLKKNRIYLIFIDLFDLNRFFYLFDFLQKLKIVLHLKQWKSCIQRIQYPIHYMVVNQMLPYY